MSLTLSNESLPSQSAKTIIAEAENYLDFRQKFLTHRPGYLTTQGTLQIKTREAQQHFLKLLTFARQVKRIYLAARQDDPYADVALLEIEQALEQANAFLQEKFTFYQQQAAQSSALSMSLVDTKKPLCVPLKFTVPYAYMAARLLAEFDTLFRCVISRHQWGLLVDSSVKQVLVELSVPLDILWQSTKTWKATGLTRAAFLESCTPDGKAIPPRKAIDPRVLDKTRRATYAPPIMVAKSKKPLTEYGKSIE